MLCTLLSDLINYLITVKRFKSRLPVINNKSLEISENFFIQTKIKNKTSPSRSRLFFVLQTNERPRLWSQGLHQVLLYDTMMHN